MPEPSPDSVWIWTTSGDTDLTTLMKRCWSCVAADPCDAGPTAPAGVVLWALDPQAASAAAAASTAAPPAALQRGCSLGAVIGRATRTYGMDGKRSPLGVASLGASGPRAPDRRFRTRPRQLLRTRPADRPGDSSQRRGGRPGCRLSRCDAPPCRAARGAGL